MQEAAVAAPGVPPELQAGEALHREEVGRQGGETVALQGEGAEGRAAGEHGAAEDGQAVVGEVQGEEGRQEENWEDSSRDSRLWLGTWKERGKEELQCPLLY